MIIICYILNFVSKKVNTIINMTKSVDHFKCYTSLRHLYLTNINDFLTYNLIYVYYKQAL